MPSPVENRGIRRQGEDVEDDFVSPLTMIRGVLEMLREDPSLADGPACRFLDLALEDCDRLGESIDRLIENNPEFVKQAKRRNVMTGSADLVSIRERVSLLVDDRIMEVDFSDYRFADTADVYRFHDIIDAVARESGDQWYIMVNFRNCTIEPTAWGAFAHRGQQTNKNHSLGTVRYAVPVDAKPGLLENDASDQAASGMFRSRQAAIDYLRKERAASNR